MNVYNLESRLYEPQWRDLFKQQRKELAAFDHSMTKRLSYALNQQDMHRGKAALLSVFSANTDLRIQFEKEQAEQRQALRSEHKQAIRDASREVHKAWQYDRDQLKSMHREQDSDRLDHYKGMSGQVWDKDQDNTAKQGFEQSATPKKNRDPEIQKRRSARDTMRDQRDRSRNRPRRPRR